MAPATRRTACAMRGGNERSPQEGVFMQLFGRIVTIRSAALAAILLATAAACASCQQHPGPTDGQMTVFITADSGSRSFNPGKFSVPMGTIVTWVNNDAVGHTVTEPGVFDSGPIPPNGGRWSWVASIAGTYTYHCLIHPDMNGTLTVTVPAPTGY
jgi:plastocyanin